MTQCERVNASHICNMSNDCDHYRCRYGESIPPTTAGSILFALIVRHASFCRLYYASKLKSDRPASPFTACGSDAVLAGGAESDAFWRKLGFSWSVSLLTDRLTTRNIATSTYPPPAPEKKRFFAADSPRVGTPSSDPGSPLARTSKGGKQWKRFDQTFPCASLPRELFESRIRFFCGSTPCSCAARSEAIRHQIPKSSPMGYRDCREGLAYGRIEEEDLYHRLVFSEEKYH